MKKSATEIQTLIRQGVPLAEGFDFRVDSVSDGFAAARFRYNSRMLRPGGTLSGPVIMTLVDATFYAAVLATIESAEMAVTTSLNINFLKRPEPGDLFAEAQLLKTGKSSVFAEVKVFSAARELVAHATGTYALPVVMAS